MTTNENSFICEEHGEYKETIIVNPFTNEPMIRSQKCQLCVNEQRKREDKIEREMEIRRRNRAACIPERYDALSLGTFPKTAKNASNLARLSTWFDKLPSLRVRAKDGPARGLWLFLYGPNGTGKTGLACSLARRFIEEDQSVMFFTVQSLIRYVWEAEKNGSSRTEAVARVSKCSLLILDEIAATTGGDAEISTLTDVINERYTRMLPIIFTGNLDTDKTMEWLQKRISSRFDEFGVDFEFSENLRTRDSK